MPSVRNRCRGGRGRVARDGAGLSRPKRAAVAGGCRSVSGLRKRLTEQFPQFPFCTPKRTGPKTPPPHTTTSSNPSHAPSCHRCLHRRHHRRPALPPRRRPYAGLRGLERCVRTRVRLGLGLAVAQCAQTPRANNQTNPSSPPHTPNSPPRHSAAAARRSVSSTAPLASVAEQADAGFTPQVRVRWVILW